MVGGLATAVAVRTFPFRVFSFPSQIIEPNFDLITATTLADLRDDILYDNFFIDTPWLSKLRKNHFELERENVIQTPFSYSHIQGVDA